MSPENIQIPIQVGFLETEGLQEKIDKPDFLYIQDKKIVIPWKDITAIWEEGDLVGNPLLTVCTEIACLSFSLSGFEIPKIFEELEEHVQGEVFLENAKSNALISKEKEVIFTNVRQSNPKKFIKNFKRPKTTIVFSTIFILFLSWSFYPSLSEAFNLRNIIFFLVVCSPIIWVFLTINREITITETYIELSDYIQKFRIYWNEIEKVSFLTEDRTIVFEGDKKRLMLPWGVWYEKTFFDDYYYFLLSYCEEYKIKFSSKGFYFLPNKNTWVRK